MLDCMIADLLDHCLDLDEELTLMGVSASLWKKPTKH